MLSGAPATPLQPANAYLYSFYASANQYNACPQEIQVRQAPAPLSEGRQCLLASSFMIGLSNFLMRPPHFCKLSLHGSACKHDHHLPEWIGAAPRNHHTCRMCSTFIGLHGSTE